MNRRPFSASLPVVLLALIALLQAAPAAGEPTPADKERAERLLREGASLYQKGDRLAAVGKFEEAYAAFPSPKILYNLGKGYRGISRNDLAHRTLSRFLREASGVSPERRKEVEGTLSELERFLGLVELKTSADGLTLMIDGDEVGTSPLAAPVAIGPGVHVAAAARGSEVVVEKQFAVGTGKRVEVTLPAPQPVSSGAEDRSFGEEPDEAERRSAGEEPDGEPSPQPGSDTGPAVVPAPRSALASGAPAKPTLDLSSSPPERREKPIYRKWWFWTAVGGVVAAGVTAGVLATSGGEVNDVNPTLGRYDFDDF